MMNIEIKSQHFQMHSVTNKKHPTHAHTNTQTKNLTKKEIVTLSCFYKPHVEMTEFP